MTNDKNERDGQEHLENADPDLREPRGPTGPGRHRQGDGRGRRSRRAQEGRQQGVRRWSAASTGWSCGSNWLVRTTLHLRRQFDLLSLASTAGGTTAGEVCAYTYVQDGHFFMDWLGVARYCFDASGDAVRAWPADGVPVASVRRVHRRAVVPAALQSLGCETLHASATRLASGVVGFCGHAGAGKSTMALACAAVGARAMG